MDLDETPLPKTPDPYFNSQEDDLTLLDICFQDNQEQPEDTSPPASQIQPRHIAAKSTQRANMRPADKTESNYSNRNRKFMDTTSIETNIKKSKDSSRKLEEHMNNNTCPKSFQYSARANIPPDETFLTEISEIKNKAEQGFVDALTRYHKRRLNNQINKL